MRQNSDYILLTMFRYRRSSKYHDKNVDYFAVTENGYFVTASSGSKFVKVWKVNIDTVLSFQILIVYSLYENGQDFLEIQYQYSPSILWRTLSPMMLSQNTRFPWQRSSPRSCRGIYSTSDIWTRSINMVWILSHPVWINLFVSLFKSLSHMPSS